MAAEGDAVRDLFGSSDDEAPQATPATEVDVKATTAALFGSSDDEEAPPAHAVTAALGDDEDEALDAGAR